MRWVVLLMFSSSRSVAYKFPTYFTTLESCSPSPRLIFGEAEYLLQRAKNIGARPCFPSKSSEPLSYRRASRSCRAILNISNVHSPETGSEDDSGSSGDQSIVPESGAEDSPLLRRRVERTAGKLQSYGLAGLLAYGFMNQLYYLGALAFVSTGPLGASVRAVPAAGSLGTRTAATAAQLAKVWALIWVGSQATKPLRAFLALLLAPAADALLTETQRRLRLPSRRRAFILICGALVASTLSICGGVVVFAALRNAPGSLDPALSLTTMTLRPIGAGKRKSRSFDRGSEVRGRGFRRGVLPLFQVREVGADGKVGREASPVREPDDDVLVSPHLDGVKNEPELATGGDGPLLSRRRRTSRKRMSTQKAADLFPPPQSNIHGWKEQPNHLLGFWSIGRARPLEPPPEGATPAAIVAAEPSIAAAAVLSAAEEGQGQTGLDSSDLEREGYSDQERAGREALDLGSDILHHVTYVVLKGDGSLKAGPAKVGVSPRSWRFTPANRRLVFEVDVPGRGVTLRYSARVRRRPYVFTVAEEGIIRVRPMSAASGERDMPTSSRSWAKLGGFSMELELKGKFARRKHENEVGGGDVERSHLSAQEDARNTQDEELRQ